jgi:Asp-tRNA(Asn)/Glu-tRNA(Gln) amidotransferase B subunit
VNRTKDLPAILDSLEAKQHKYETIARAHEAAAALVKLIDEGKMDKETARQIFVMVEGQAAHEEVRELYRDLSARI